MEEDGVSLSLRRLRASKPLTAAAIHVLWRLLAYTTRRQRQRHKHMLQHAATDVHVQKMANRSRAALAGSGCQLLLPPASTSNQLEIASEILESF